MKISKPAGFTLIELLVVISIIGILVTGLVTLINPATQIQKSQDAKIKSDLSQIQKALETYYSDNNQYPTSNGSYQIVATVNGAANTIVNWGTIWNSTVTGGTPYMATLPADPVTTHKYAYYSPTGQYYYLYANLNRGSSDAQICKNLNANGECPSVPAANICTVKCNFGLSSPDKTP